MYGVQHTHTFISRDQKQQRIETIEEMPVPNLWRRYLNAMLVIASTGFPGESDQEPNASIGNATGGASWTVMVYANGHNSLDPQIRQNVVQMTRVADSPRVNIVVEWGSQDWPQHVYRFKVSQGMQLPEADKAAPNGFSDLGEANMGDKDTLKSFVDWGKQHFPASYSMLVIAAHGAGYREQELALLAQKQRLTPGLLGEYASLIERKGAHVVLTAQEAAVERAAYYLDETKGNALVLKMIDTGPPATPTPAPTVKAGPKANPAITEALEGELSSEDPSRTEPTTGNVRVISKDDNKNKFLYNSDVADVIAASNVDVIGFDSCLMSMVETAFAMKDGAKYMVGSEELEPGDGWVYNDWLGSLVAKPTLSPKELGEAVVTSYSSQYRKSSRATLSSTDLGGVGLLAQRICDLAKVLHDSLGDPRSLEVVKKARSLCLCYGNSSQTLANGWVYDYNYVDLGCFVNALLASKADKNIIDAAQLVRDSLAASVRAWACPRRSSAGFESKGLSIYFPQTAMAHSLDVQNPLFGLSYNRANADHPIAFVNFPAVGVGWSDFLDSYYKMVP
jgi:hypothetical protein